MIKVDSSALLDKSSAYRCAYSVQRTQYSFFLFQCKNDMKRGNLKKRGNEERIR